MKKQTSKQLLKAIREQHRKEKTYKGEWYTVNSIFGNDWARWFYLLGGREAGKSYSVMKWAVNRKCKLKDQMKFYWFRLTDAQADNLLAEGASNFVDPDIQRKYNLKLTRKAKTLYSYDEEITTNKSGKETVRKVNLEPFCQILSCSTFYNDKGKGYFDNEFRGEYLVVLDEMNREQSERNNFDIVYNFANQLENVLRSTTNKVRIVCIGNTLEEASDLLSAINFIPDGFGRYKLKSKKAIVDYIKPNEQYLQRRKDAAANQLIGNSSTMTNECILDKSLIVNKRLCQYPTEIIKFNKEESDWFTVWNGNIIKPYSGESKPTTAMKRYLDDFFMQEKADSVFERFDMRSFKFTTLSCFKQFQKQLRLLKRK